MLPTWLNDTPWCKNLNVTFQATVGSASFTFAFCSYAWTVDGGHGTFFLDRDDASPAGATGVCAAGFDVAPLGERQQRQGEHDAADCPGDPSKAA